MSRLTVALLALAAVAASVAEPAEGQPSAFGERACRLSMAGLPAAFERCGTLLVAENPDEPTSAQLELFVARATAETATPRPDPLLVITGGPGGSTVDFYLQARGAFGPVQRDRDIILVDQRGTGRSSAGFECDVPEDLSLETAGESSLASFVTQCLQGLTRDPKLYTTSVAVRDLERVRAALGIEQWNIYGVSYGTRVAQHYLRRYPERVRALVLDGVVPPDLVLGPDIARAAQAALDAIFARCAAAPACSERFPELPARFATLLERVAAEPIAGPGSAPGTPNFTADHLRAVARFMSYSSATAALLPVLFDEAYAGRHAPLVSQSQTTLRGLPESLSFPLHNSVACTEDAPFLDAAGTDGLEGTYLGTAIVDGLKSLCAAWPRGVLDADFKEPVVSDRPVLFLSGENDPATPAAYAERAIANGLANSAHLIGRGQGHGLLVIGCVPRLLRDFLENPEPAALDGSCLDREPPAPFFLSLLGPAP